jgi:hypothetical protein
MTTPEGQIKDKFKRRLKPYVDMGKVYAFWPVQRGLGARTLDLLLCVNGRFIGIEFKRPGGSPTLLQGICMRSIAEAGGEALVIDSGEVIDTVIESLKALLGE